MRCRKASGGVNPRSPKVVQAKPREMLLHWHQGRNRADIPTLGQRDSIMDAMLFGGHRQSDCSCSRREVFLDQQVFGEIMDRISPVRCVSAESGSTRECPRSVVHRERSKSGDRCGQGASDEDRSPVAGRLWQQCPQERPGQRLGKPQSRLSSRIQLPA